MQIAVKIKVKSLPVKNRHNLTILLLRNVNNNHSKSGEQQILLKNRFLPLYVDDNGKAYLNEAIKFKAILDPFKDPPLKNLYISPLMTREKLQALHRRVIVNLSILKAFQLTQGLKVTHILTPHSCSPSQV